LLDRQLAEVREMVDALAERIATMGGIPIGTPGHISRSRGWDDYALAKATVPEHLAALDIVYSGIIADHREAQQATRDLDPVTEDLLIGQLRKLELLQWLVRAHLESSAGAILTVAKTETAAAARARRAFAG
jgi:starvation-inducible DNA-binding protein